MRVALAERSSASVFAEPIDAQYVCDLPAETKLSIAISSGTAEWVAIPYRLAKYDKVEQVGFINIHGNTLHVKYCIFAL